MWSSVVSTNNGNIKLKEINRVKKEPKDAEKIERIGFINSKNDCFFHIVLQVLLTVPKFSWDKEDEFCLEMHRLSKEIYRSNDSIFPDRIHELMESKYPNFLTVQQDVTECFYMIIDMLHDSMKTETLNDVEEDEWMEIGYKSKAVAKRNYSFHNSPFQVFYGQFCNIILKNNKKSAKSIEPFLFVSLELSNSVQFAMNQYAYSNFKSNENTYIQSLPEILTIQLKRFYFNKQSGLSKNNKNADYSSVLQVPCFANDVETVFKYKLYAVIYHIGKTIESGHYTCALYDDKLESWLFIDDTKVVKISIQQLMHYRRNEAYMLMYYK
eukprot:NODE_303_length_11391_cov_0.177028.p2 type:complete len:325 gc:universal NODE_303_length_11391_cov_0.177028:7370-8344(+)